MRCIAGLAFLAVSLHAESCIVVPNNLYQRAILGSNDPAVLLGYPEGMTIQNETITQVGTDWQICFTPASISVAPPSTVPEIDPKSSLIAVALLSGVLAILKRLR